MEKADRSVLKKWISLSGAVLAVVYSVNCFLLYPLTASVTNNVVYAETAIPMLLEYIAELLELGGISMCYAVMLLAVYFWGTKSVKGVFGMFCLVTFYKYMANTVSSWVNGGSIPLSWAWDLTDVLFWTLLEFLQMFIIFSLSKGIITKYTDKRLVMLRASKKTDEHIEGIPPHAYPFQSIIDNGNCLLRSAFICATVTLIAKLGGAVISDVWLIIAYGIPTEGITWLYMAVNYLIKAIMGCISYLFVYAAMSSLTKDLEA